MQIFFFKKCLFEYENQFAVEKKTKNVWGQFQKYFCRRDQTNASHTISENKNKKKVKVFSRSSPKNA